MSEDDKKLLVRLVLYPGFADQGMRKKAWYLMRDYYMKKRNNR